MEVINLNLIPSGALPVVHASQYDEGRTFRANLMDGSTVYTLDGTEVLECDVKKPDGNIVTVAVTNTSDSYLEITTTLQMCACSGESLGEINIKKDGVSIGTLNFILAVERSPLENGIESESAIYNLQEQIGDAVADQYDADSVVFDAVPTAGHGVGFAVTSEGVLNSIPEELDDLSDVATTTPTNGEALVWDGSKWTNGTVSTVGSIDDLNDVDTTGKVEGDSLRYNATAQEWEAKPTTVEMTLAEYTALGGDYSGYENTNIIITDAPNLNATAQDISYDGSTDTVWDKVEANATAISGILSDISALYNLATKVSLAANTTKTVTVTQDNASRVGYIVFGQAAQGNLSPIFYLVGGYVTASRCSVTNISGKTGVTVDSSSTANLNFGFINTTGVPIDLYFLPLYDNTFTAS